MKRKREEFEIAAEAPEIACIRERVGMEVPIRTRYVRGQRPILLSIEHDLCTLRFPNGVVMNGVPIADLVDDSAFWK